MESLKWWDWRDWFVGIFCFIIVVGVSALVGFMIYDELTADHFSLRKDSWACTRSHVATHLQPVGKALIPITQDVCDQWTATRRGE